MTVPSPARFGHPGALQVALLATVGLSGALCLRLGLAGSAGVASKPAGLAFAVALLAVVRACGAPVLRPGLRSSARGLAGGALLCLGPLTHRLVHGFVPPVPGFASWVAVVVLVAVTQELVLRGVLFSALQELAGDVVAVGATSALFALMHVPLYGWEVVPLDLLVGVLFGLLRLWDGSVTAPAVAHATADMAGWWLR